MLFRSIADRKLLLRLGGFNLTYRIAADIDLMLRAWRAARSTAYVPVTLVHMRAGGASNSGLGAIARANWECMRSLWAQGMWFAPVAIAGKLLRKIAQLKFN